MSALGVNPNTMLLSIPLGSPYQMQFRIKDASGEVQPLVGRNLQLTIFGKKTALAPIAGVYGTDTDGDYLMFSIDGSLTSAIPHPATWEIAELYLGINKTPMLSGQVFIGAAAPIVNPGTYPPSAYDSVSWSPSLDKVIVVQAGDKGPKGDKGDDGGTAGPALLISHPNLGTAPSIPGIIDGTIGQFIGDGTSGAGTLVMRYSNDTKGGSDFYVKSRATTVAAIGTSPGALISGDKIHTLSIFGDAGQGYVAHIGQRVWGMDGAPLGDATELPGYYSISTGTGGHLTGQRCAIEMNSRQQVHFPGPNSTAFGPTGASWGANLTLGVGAVSAGSAPLKFIVTGAALLTTPEPGAFECDATGNLYFTNAAGVRKQVTLT